MPAKQRIVPSVSFKQRLHIFVEGSEDEYVVKKDDKGGLVLLIVGANSHNSAPVQAEGWNIMKTADLRSFQHEEVEQFSAVKKMIPIHFPGSPPCNRNLIKSPNRNFTQRSHSSQCINRIQRDSEALIMPPSHLKNSLYEGNVGSSIYNKNYWPPRQQTNYHYSNNTKHVNGYFSESTPNNNGIREPLDYKPRKKPPANYFGAYDLRNTGRTVKNRPRSLH